MKNGQMWTTGLLLAISLAACSKAPAPVEEIRPVRLATAHAGAVDLQNTYAGDVRPRFESSLGFRVAGKILERRVNVGDAVKAGDVLARLDPRDLSLSEASSRANVAAQEASFEIEKADLERYRGLLAQGFISHAEYERQQSKFRAAQAQLDALRAAYRVSANQSGYAELRADHDGTISGIAAEAGQVVAAGQTVATLAWAGQVEVAANVPEDQVRRLRAGMPVEVSLWTDASRTFPGRVRELSSSADAATRTYSLRVVVPDAPEEMRLGMTASVRIPVPNAPLLFRLPLAAMVEQGGHKGVWLFDAPAGAVRFRAAEPVGVVGNDALFGPGLSEGERVVTAGAALLHEGQKVRPLDEAAVAAR